MTVSAPARATTKCPDSNGFGEVGDTRIMSPSTPAAKSVITSSVVSKFNRLKSASLCSSRPAPPVRMSTSASEATSSNRSSPSPPLIISEPMPPDKTSLPSPPSRRSSPSPPLNVSIVSSSAVVIWLPRIRATQRPLAPRLPGTVSNAVSPSVGVGR